MDDNNIEEALQEEEGKGKSPLRKAVGLLLRWGLPLALTVLLVWYLFRKVDFARMMDLIRHGVDYGWILLAMGISVVSHLMRACRWRIQLRALGINPPFMAVACSIFGTYALNLVFPRLGEVWRCTYIANREKAPFSEVLGSMVADRVADLVMVGFLTLFTFIVAAPALEAFLERYPIGRGLLDLLRDPWLWVAIAILGAAIWAIFRYGRGNRAVAKVWKWICQMWSGFAVVGKMKGKWGFLFFSVALWTCYFFQLYVAFFAFPFTRDLVYQSGTCAGMVPCLVAFVLSSIGMAVPSNGGLGPWNIAVMFGLAVYGLSDEQGTAFSMLQWSGQTVMLIILGIFTMAYIAISKKGNPSPKKAAKNPAA